MKTALALAIAGMALVTATATTAFAVSKSNRITVTYVLPNDPAHQLIYERLKEHRALERLQRLLSPFRLPRTLKVSLAGCDGEADAFYGDDAITICYEYIHELWKNMPAETTAAGIAPMDTVIGPLFDTSLHEFAHALFDMHKSVGARARGGRGRSGGGLYQFNANQSFPTTAGLHHFEVRPSGFLTGSMAPPGVAPGSPVEMKQFSRERLVS
jgi:Putative metallopeptidase